MTQSNHIPQGYKSSSLGIIPKNWEVKKLGEFSTFFSGGTPKSDNTQYYNGSIPFIRSGEINRNKTELFLSQEGFNNSSAKIVEEGDILYALYGANSGQCSLSKINGAINQAILCVRPKADRYYIMSVLQLNKEHYYNSYLQGGQGNLSGEIVSNYKIAVPPIEEQKKIVEVLSEWDKAIELQTKLIEKLELRKRALMQRLLTGRVRLNGFSDKWEKKRLSEVGVFLSSNTLSRDKLNKTQGFIQNIHYGDILIHYPTIVSPEQCQIPYINEDVIVTSDLLQDGDIVFADTAEDNTVGKAIEIVNVSIRQIVAGLHTIPFRPNKGLFAKQFLGYYVNSVSYQKQLEGLIQGIKVCSISKSSIKNTYLQIPSLGEQTAIAKVLIAADKEIKVERQKLSILHTQKRGLMQQLLTGKKRIMSSLRSV